MSVKGEKDRTIRNGRLDICRLSSDNVQLKYGLLVATCKDKTLIWRKDEEKNGYSGSPKGGEI